MHFPDIPRQDARWWKYYFIARHDTILKKSPYEQILYGDSPYWAVSTCICTSYAT
jgi:hypothetical protein